MQLEFRFIYGQDIASSVEYSASDGLKLPGASSSELCDYKRDHRERGRAPARSDGNHYQRQNRYCRNHKIDPFSDPDLLRRQSWIDEVALACHISPLKILAQAYDHDVEIEHPPERVGQDVEERRVDARARFLLVAAGAVDEDVDAAVGVHHQAGRRLDALALQHVARDRDRVAARGLDVVDDRRCRGCSCTR